MQNDASKPEIVYDAAKDWIVTEAAGSGAGFSLLSGIRPAEIVKVESGLLMGILLVRHRENLLVGPSRALLLASRGKRSRANSEHPTGRLKSLSQQFFGM